MESNFTTITNKLGDIRYISSNTRNFKESEGEYKRDENAHEYALGCNCTTIIGLKDGTKIEIDTDYCGELKIYYPKDNDCLR